MDPFVVVLGVSSSGSSVIAGVSYHVGLWLGKQLGGRYGTDPDNQCGFEDAIITRMCSMHCPWRAKIREPRLLREKLYRRIANLQAGARRRNTIAGAKLPRLCRLGPMFDDILDDSLYVIDCDRPMEDSIASVERGWYHGRQARKNIEWAWGYKQEFLGLVPPERKIAVKYYDLLKNPEQEARKIAAFLGLKPTAEQLAKAVRIVHPDMQHVGQQTPCATTAATS